MAKTRMLYVRLSRRQFEQLQENCRNDGFETLSSYVRHMALDRDLLTQQKIWEIHDHLLGAATSYKIRPKKRGDGLTHTTH